MRRRIVLVPMSMEATLLTEEGLDFTAEFLWDDVGCEFRVKNLEGCRSSLISTGSSILSKKATY
jgi:hypothetical protein